jgi:hypothetical protein
MSATAGLQLAILPEQELGLQQELGQKQVFAVPQAEERHARRKEIAGHLHSNGDYVPALSVLPVRVKL